MAIQKKREKKSRSNKKIDIIEMKCFVFNVILFLFFINAALALNAHHFPQHSLQTI